jgi:hypothetical protein
MRTGLHTAIAALALACLTTLTSPTLARAAQDAAHVTNEPAATLLLPYFEAQVPAKIGGKGKGINTLFSINNASASAAIAHVTIWSDLAIPVINFDVYLTGYDVARISMQDILNGVFPLTGDAGADITDNSNNANDNALSNKGILSQDINFPGSTGPCTRDTIYSEAFPEASVQHIRAALTGKFSPLLNGCFGLDYGDKKPIARGFITVDSVTQCSTLNPNDPGYGNFGVADTRDILWGDYEILDKTKKVARADALVHVRSTQTFQGVDPEVGDAGQYTFYGRFESVAGKVARQPLATKFAAPYANRGKKDKFFPQGTALTVWRDPKVSDADPFPCGTRPSWYPLGQEEVLAFDAQENVEVVAPGAAFGAATQRVQVDGPSLPISFLEGWLYMNLNTTVAGAPIPAEDPAAAQAWVTVDKNSKGKFSVQTRAIPIDSATEVLHQQLFNN